MLPASPASIFEVRRYNPITNAPLPPVTNEILSANATFKLYGGCETATIVFAAEFGDARLVDPGDGVTILRDGIEVYSGRCRSCEPAYGEPNQTVELEGWWYRVAERMAVIPSTNDHITFGQADESDHPLITTAYGVAMWIAQNRIANDPASAIDINGPDVIAPDYPCKLAGPFMIYAKDDLATVLETLATMENCVTGIDGAGRFYYKPRVNVLANDIISVVAKGTPPDGWRAGAHGVPHGGGTFVYDNRAPNQISIFGRAASADGVYTEAVRDYHLVNSGQPPETAKTVGYRAAGIYTGVQARRLARGLFDRFSTSTLRVESMDVQAGTERFEPHLGRVNIFDEGQAVTYAHDIASVIKITFERFSIKADITIGENSTDPGSGNPVNDPWASDPGEYDLPQVDTGDGLEDPDYSLPSVDIDLDDGWLGDGDDLHQNPSRDFPSDPPGSGVDGVDYGKDRPAKQEPNAVQPVGVAYLGVITVVNNATSYDVQLYSSDGTTSLTTLENVPVWPTPHFRYLTGQKVLVHVPYPGGAAWIDGNADNNLWPGLIDDPGEGDGPTVSVCNPVTPYDTPIASFAEVETYPTPDEQPEYVAGQKVLLGWFPLAAKPVILQTGGGGGGSGCFVSPNWGPLIG